MADNVKTVPETNPAPVVENELTTTLKSYNADDATIRKITEELGVETMEELASLDVKDLTDAGMKLAKAKTMLAKLNAATVEATPAPAPVAEVRPMQNNFDTFLPAVPSDDSWLLALKTGGILKVDESSYIAAIRAALADKAGLYNVPEALAKAMEQFADETEEQVDRTFYSLRRTLTRRNYSDIFEAIDGLDGSFITDRRRKDFLGRIRDNLWPAISESYRAIDAWYQTYNASLANPSALVAAFRGNPAMAMTNIPDTSPLHDAGDTLVNSINRVFRGTGIQVAAALAYDANEIRKTMEDPRLPAMVGAKNRELMLKKIGTNVSSNYVRLEQNLVKYVLAFTRHNTITSDVEADYFIALWQLGAQINWAELGGVNPTTAAVMGMTGKNLL